MLDKMDRQPEHDAIMAMLSSFVTIEPFHRYKALGNYVIWVMHLGMDGW